MNLLFDCHTFDAGPQGTTTFLAGLLNTLPEAADAAGRSLAITCAGSNPAATARFVGIPHGFRPIATGFARRNAIDLPRLTQDPGFDAVVSQYVRPFRSAVPTVSVIHDVLFLDYPDLFDWRYRYLRRRLFGWAARHSNAVVTVSAYSRDRIAHHFGIDPARIDIVPNALDVTAPLPAMRPAPVADAPLRLLYVSRFERRKRQHWCIAAARVLAAAGRTVELTLVGHSDGAYADQVRTAIATTAPGVTIEIRSDISADALDALYRRCDLFLFPSRCEGFGIPVIEAAAHGLPCVVADNTAMIELRDRYAGVAVTDDGEDAFVRAVMDAAGVLPRLSAEALALAPATRAAFRWPDVARSFVDVLVRRGIVR